MVESIPKNLQEKLAIIFVAKGTEEFCFDDVGELLGYTRSYMGQFLSKLVKAGWIEKRVDPSDGRRKIYRIINPDDTLKRLGERIKNKKK